MNHNFILLSIGLLLILSCNEITNDATIKNNDKISTNQAELMHDKVDSLKQEKVGEYDDKEGVEINDYRKFYHDSFMRITYRSSIDTVFGFKNLDTFYFDGDIKMIYPKTGSKGVASMKSLWSHNSSTIVVPYKFAGNADQKFKGLIGEGMRLWTKRLDSIKFVPYTQNDNYFILFVPSQTLTQSFVGKIPGGQSIEIKINELAGSVAHEIGHALGLYHEQSRSDRNKYVLIDLACQGAINYRFAYKEPSAIDIGKYDFNSIMHYPFSSCMKVINLPDTATPGQRFRVSDGDIYSIKTLYKLR